MDILDKYQETAAQLYEEAGISPLSKYVTTSGPVENVHYLELGSGKPLVLIHGGLSHSSEWIDILKPLSAHFHLYVPDRPGHGLTDRIDYRGINYRTSATTFIRSFMDAVGLSNASLLGNSMGGYFAICFALAHSERVDQLGLIGAPAGMNLWIPPMLRALGIGGLNRFLMKTVARPSISSQRDIHKQIIVADIDHVSKLFLEHASYNHQLPGARLAMSSLLENVLNLRGWKKELYLTPELANLQMPVHFIWGSEDAFEGPVTGREKASAIANHTFEVVQDAGHCPWLDKPVECSDLIISKL